MVPLAPTRCAIREEIARLTSWCSPLTHPGNAAARLVCDSARMKGVTGYGRRKSRSRGTACSLLLFLDFPEQEVLDAFHGVDGRKRPTVCSADEASPSTGDLALAARGSRLGARRACSPHEPEFPDQPSLPA